MPLVRIPNPSLEPGPAGGERTASLAEQIADTPSGILIDGAGSFSIDQQRRNFQFGGDAFWQIENGRVIPILVAYALDCDLQKSFNMGVMSFG